MTTIHLRQNHKTYKYNLKDLTSDKFNNRRHLIKEVVEMIKEIENLKEYKDITEIEKYHYSIANQRLHKYRQEMELKFIAKSDQIEHEIIKITPPPKYVQILIDQFIRAQEKKQRLLVYKNRAQDKKNAKQIVNQQQQSTMADSNSTNLSINLNDTMKQPFNNKKQLISSQKKQNQTSNINNNKKKQNSSAMLKILKVFVPCLRDKKNLIDNGDDSQDQIEVENNEINESQFNNNEDINNSQKLQSENNNKKQFEQELSSEPRSDNQLKYDPSESNLQDYSERNSHVNPQQPNEIEYQKSGLRDLDAIFDNDFKIEVELINEKKAQLRAEKESIIGKYNIFVFQRYGVEVSLEMFQSYDINQLSSSKVIDEYIEIFIGDEPEKSEKIEMTNNSFMSNNILNVNNNSQIVEVN